MEHFVIIVNGWKLLPIITKSSILDAAAVLEPPLVFVTQSNICDQKQPPEVFYNKRRSQKFPKIYRKTPVPESLFLQKMLMTIRH